MAQQEPEIMGSRDRGRSQVGSTDRWTDSKQRELDDPAWKMKKTWC